MEKEELKTFLQSERIRNKMSIEDVAKSCGMPIDFVKHMEEEPLKTPLNKISKVLMIYNSSIIEFETKLLNVNKKH